MGRKKVNLQWIDNNATRRATYKQRCESLVKKASELTTLYGTKMCVVVYADGQAQPEVWPSDAEAKQLVENFRDMTNLGNFKKTQNQAEFLHGRTLSLQEQVSKLDLDNRERETLDLLHDCLDGRHPGLVGTTKDELISLSEMVEMKMSKVKARLQQLGVVGQGALPDPLQVMQPVSSSSQMQAPASSYTYNEMQAKAPLEEQQMQQDWPLASLAYGELGSALYDGFVGFSSGFPWA